MISENDIKSLLKTIPDPDSENMDIIESNAVQSIHVEGGEILCVLQVAPDKGTQMEEFRLAVDHKLKQAAPDQKVTTILTAEKSTSAAPVASQTEMKQGEQKREQGASPADGQRSRPSSAPALVPDVGAVIAVASGKGGVGKSTVAVNLAAALAKIGYKTGLMDADIYGPSVPKLTGLSGQKPGGGQHQAGPGGTEYKMIEPLEAFGMKVMSIGFMIAEESPMIWRGPMVQSAIVQILRDVNWGALDFLIIDMPPGTGDAQLTLAQKVPLSGAVIVSTPQDIALIDARKGLAMFDKVGVPVLGLIENMSYFHCPSCGERSEIFGHGGARAEAEKLEIPFLGEIPLEAEIRSVSDSGETLLTSESANRDIFLSFAGQVSQAVETAPPVKAPKIVIEQ